jgi:arylsulfatase
VVGAAAGGLMGKFTDRKVKARMGELGENLPPGTAGIIAVFDDEYRLGVEQKLPGSPAKSVAQTDKEGVRALKEELAEAMGKFKQDRTVLPIPDRTFGGTMGRTLKDSVADWSMIPGPKAPERAPNVLVVLIDDAGFGAIDTFGGPVSTPAFTRVQQMGITYNRFHVTAVFADPRRVAHREEPASGRLRLDRRVSGTLPRLHRREAAELRRVPSHLEGERLRHGWVR